MNEQEHEELIADISKEILQLKKRVEASFESSRERANALLRLHEAIIWIKRIKLPEEEES